MNADDFLLVSAVPVNLRIIFIIISRHLTYAGLIVVMVSDETAATNSLLMKSPTDCE